MKDKRMPKISIGMTSMTVILCILCLTILSVLSLSTAISERNLSQKRAAAVQNYYVAEGKAATIVNTLQQKIRDNENLEPFIERNHITQKEKNFSFQIPVDDQQIFSVAVEMNDGCNITCWQIISALEWSPDETLPVWDGEVLNIE